MSEKKNIMADDTIYCVYTFGISAVLMYLGAGMAFHG